MTKEFVVVGELLHLGLHNVDSGTNYSVQLKAMKTSIYLDLVFETPFVQS